MAQSFRILLVEDNDSLRACLGEFLASQGWDVASTAFANEALTMMRRQRFDFSLLDFHLPETTGPELLQQLATVRPLPSILMSGLANAAEVAAARQAGFFTFLRKPLNLDHLRQSLELLIQSHFGGPLAPWSHSHCSPPTQGNQPQGNQPQGNQPQGNQPQGNQPQGNQPGGHPGYRPPTPPSQ